MSDPSRGGGSWSEQLILASASPRRAALLDQLGLRYRRCAVAVDETPLNAEDPAAYVERLALAKARAGQSASRDPGLPVLGADTTVVHAGVVMGKPDDEPAACEAILQLSGCAHEVLTAVAVAQGSRHEIRLSRSVVHFRRIEESEAQAYARTGEGADKAGGYAIQGIGGVFVTRIEGSYTGIVGLPIAETEALLLAFGVDTWQYR